MILSTHTDSLAKSAIISIAAITMLAACSDAKSTSGIVDARTSYETADDHALGNPDAKITVVEYASVTCPHCANWHETVWPDFREKYVDTGKVRYVFREFPTPPADLARAGFLVANCAPEDKFFNILHVQFKRQREILTSSDIRGEYVLLAKSAGMNEADFDACMANEVENERLNTVINTAFDAGVRSAPTFFINDKKHEVFKLEDFDRMFAEILDESDEPDSKSGEKGH